MRHFYLLSKKNNKLVKNKVRKKIGLVLRTFDSGLVIQSSNAPGEKVQKSQNGKVCAAMAREPTANTVQIHKWCHFQIVLHGRRHAVFS